jgi:hypothetical protein
VAEGWTTAMVMEDDADWDGGIHESMALAWDALIKFTNDPLAATEAQSSGPRPPFPLLHTPFSGSDVS